MKRKVKRNPLKNPKVMRRLNPYSYVLKTQARANNQRRQKARELILRAKSGQKVDAKLLKKATALLGIREKKAKATTAAAKK